MWLVCCTFSNLSNPGYIHDARSIQCSVNGRNTRGIRRCTFADRSRCKLCFQYHRQTNSLPIACFEVLYEHLPNTWYLISIFHFYPTPHIHAIFQNSKWHPNLTFDLVIFLSSVMPTEFLGALKVTLAKFHPSEHRIWCYLKQTTWNKSSTVANEGKNLKIGRVSPLDSEAHAQHCWVWYWWQEISFQQV